MQVNNSTVPGVFEGQHKHAQRDTLVILGQGEGKQVSLEVATHHSTPMLGQSTTRCQQKQMHSGRAEEDADKLTSLGRQFRRMQHYLPDLTREVTNNLTHYDLNRQDSRHFRYSRVPGDLVSRSLGLLKGSNKQPKNSNSQVEAPQVRAITP